MDGEAVADGAALAVGRHDEDIRNALEGYLQGDQPCGFYTVVVGK